MTPYEIQVPLIALGIGIGSLVYVRWLSRRLDRELEREQEQRRRARSAE